MADLDVSYVRKNFRYENGKLIRTNWGNIGLAREVGTRCVSGYLTFGMNYKNYKVHRVVWILHYGDIPVGHFIDHINGIVDDNRIENLRLANPNENQHNRRKRKSNQSSKYKGVSYKKKDRLFQASISYQYKYIHLGSYKNEIEAALAYNKAAKELFGDRAFLNEVRSA